MPIPSFKHHNNRLIKYNQYKIVKQRVILARHKKMKKHKRVLEMTHRLWQRIKKEIHFWICWFKKEYNFGNSLNIRTWFQRMRGSICLIRWKASLKTKEDWSTLMLSSIKHYCTSKKWWELPNRLNLIRTPYWTLLRID